MVNTDNKYMENQRILMCRHAIRKIPEQDVQFLGGLTGRSNFFILDEGFVGENIPEFQLVRAFQCPTDPPLFLQVRHQTHKGTTVTIIMKEDKPNKCIMFLMSKPVGTIKPALSK